MHDWQNWTAVAIAVVAGIWAAWTIFTPIINEFRKKKTPDAGCCGCGTKVGPCGAKKTEPDGLVKP